MRDLPIQIIKHTDDICALLQDIGHTLYMCTRAALSTPRRAAEEWDQARRETAALVDLHLPPVTAALDAYFAQLTALDADLSEAERRVCRSDIQTRLQPFFLQSPFMRRATDKPFGYPGDYVTVEMLFDNKADGESPLGQLLARYALDAGPARAHRARLPWVLDHLRERGRDAPVPDVLSFACGPERVLREHVASGGDCEITLCDADERALQYAEKKIVALEGTLGRRPRVRTVQASAFALVKGEIPPALVRTGGETRGYDLILVLGLLDYLPARVCARFIRVLAEMLEPGGECLLTNVHVENPWRSLMEYVTDWFVIHRSREEMLEVATSQSGLSPVTLVTDASGVNVFFTGRRGG